MNNIPPDEEKEEMPRDEFAVELAVNVFVGICMVIAGFSLLVLFFPS